MRLFVRPCIPFVVVFIGGAMGCGQTTRSPDAVGAQGGGGMEGGSGGATEGGSGGATEGGASSEATYAGVVLAMVTEDEPTPSYVARAVFATGPRPTLGGCPHCCCGSTDRGLPVPRKPPDAGQITLAPAAGSAAQATLVPEAFENGNGTFYGMTDSSAGHGSRRSVTTHRKPASRGTSATPSRWSQPETKSSRFRGACRPVRRWWE